MDANEFRRLGHRLVDWIADYRERLETLPVASPVRPGEIRARFPVAAPEEGGGAAAAIEALGRDVLPTSGWGSASTSARTSCATRSTSSA
jgi:aromatic-L-amino-acid/L-tryptophan decarboxylase